MFGHEQFFCKFCNSSWMSSLQVTIEKTFHPTDFCTTLKF